VRLGQTVLAALAVLALQAEQELPVAAVVVVTAVVQQVATLHPGLAVQVVITLPAPVAALRIRLELVAVVAVVGRETILEKQAGPGLIYLTPLAVVAGRGVRLAMFLLGLWAYSMVRVAQAELLMEVSVPLRAALARKVLSSLRTRLALRVKPVTAH
jgi:hypothetical protein